MPQGRRFAIGLLILAGLVAAVLGVDALRGRNGDAVEGAAGEPTLAAGAIPIRVDGGLAGGFSPADLERLEEVSFVDAEEGKTQEGWLLRDILLLYVGEARLEGSAAIAVLSSARAKRVELTWAEVREPANWVMLDLSGRGTLKLVSTLDRLDTRDEWVQDIDAIEVASR